MSKFQDVGGYHAMFQMVPDPLYFGRWFVKQLKSYAGRLAPDETASVLTMDEQYEIVAGIRYLSDLDNCPFEIELVCVDEHTGSRGVQIIRGFWYSVFFPWAETREFYHSVDGMLIQPLVGKGDLFMASGLLDLVFCLDVWLSDNMRKPEFLTATTIATKGNSPVIGSTQTNQKKPERPTMRTKNVLDKLGIKRSTFHDLTRKAGLHNASHGHWYVDDIKKLAKENGFNCP